MTIYFYGNLVMYSRLFLLIPTLLAFIQWNKHIKKKDYLLKKNNSQPITPIKQIDRSILNYGILALPAMTASGLGLFAKLDENPETLHALFGNTSIVNGLLIFGVPLSLFCSHKITKLKLERANLSE
jgi:hypothetical protein